MIERAMSCKVEGSWVNRNRVDRTPESSILHARVSQDVTCQGWYEICINLMGTKSITLPI